MHPHERFHEQAQYADEQLHILVNAQFGPTQLNEEVFGDLSPFMVSADDYERKKQQLSHYYIYHQKIQSTDSYAQASVHTAPDPYSRYPLLLFGEFGQPKLKPFYHQPTALLYTGFNLGIANSRDPGLCLFVTQLQGERTKDKTFASETFGQFKFRELIIQYMYLLSVWLRFQGVDTLKYVGVNKIMHDRNRQAPDERRQMVAALGHTEQARVLSVPNQKHVRAMLLGEDLGREQDTFLRPVTESYDPFPQNS